MTQPDPTEPAELATGGIVHGDGQEVIGGGCYGIGLILPPVSFADQLIARHGQPMRDAIDRARVRYEADKAAARLPRRRWWHRLTRRAL